jgi:predicted AAA+ superfamily ATPase
MELEELIYLQNPWFRDRGFRPAEEKLPKRKIFPQVLKEIATIRQITSITGVRRVGKSTLLKQIIAKLLQDDESEESILYFSFDQPTVEETPHVLEEIISFYFQKILNREVNKLSRRVFLFFDEIQLVPFWQDVLKRYFDLNKNIKFVVSGSASLYISTKAKESLAGRIFEKSLGPLSFSEFKLLFKSQDFYEFLDFGQFPEFREIKEGGKRIEYLKEGVVGRVLNLDIPKTFGIRKTLDFERLFWSLLPNTGQIINSARLASDLQLKKATLFKYLSVLEKSLLVEKVLNLSGSFRSESRLLRKFYPASTNFLNLIPETISWGFKAESYVANLLRQKYREVFLYRKGGKEIDFILPQRKLAIEVKYQGNLRSADYLFLKKYIEEKGYEGMMVLKEPLAIPEPNIKGITIEELEAL